MCVRVAQSRYALRYIFYKERLGGGDRCLFGGKVTEVYSVFKVLTTGDRLRFVSH